MPASPWPQHEEGNMILDVVIGGIAGILALAYLLYALLRPEKF